MSAEKSYAQRTEGLWKFVRIVCTRLSAATRRCVTTQTEELASGTYSYMTHLRIKFDGIHTSSPQIHITSKRVSKSRSRGSKGPEIAL